MSQYGRVDYWNERYTKEKDPFDWYQRYIELKHLFTPSTLSPGNTSSFPPKETLRVLVPGCGNSNLMEDMVNDGYSHITCVDFSTVVISQMKERYSEKEEITFIEADVTQTLPFPDESFDLIICKGTTDAILCSPGSGINLRAFMQECSRVLNRQHGVMMTVSYGSPENRLLHMEDENIWPGSVEVITIPKPKVNDPNVDQKSTGANHYVYMCRKGLKEREVNDSSEHEKENNDENVAEDNLNDRDTQQKEESLKN